LKTLLILTLSAALAGPAFGGRRRVVAASPSAHDAITIAFVGVTGIGSDAMVDAGAVSQARSKRIRRTFGIRLDAPASAEGATATLHAYLESYDGRCTIRVDGVLLGTVPLLIDAHMPIGTVTRHTIEIEVPESVPEGAFASSVRWDVGTN